MNENRMKKILQAAIVLGIGVGIIFGVHATAKAITWGCLKSPACLNNLNKPKPAPSQTPDDKNVG